MLDDRRPWKSTVRIGNFASPVELNVEPNRLSFERTESISPGGLPRLVVHDSKLVVHGRSWLAPPWVNNYVVLTQGGEVYVVPILNFQVRSLLEALDGAGFEVRHATDWLMMLSGRRRSRRIYQSHLVSIEAGFSDGQSQPDRAPAFPSTDHVVEMGESSERPEGFGRRFPIELSRLLSAAALICVLALAAPGLGKQESEAIAFFAPVFYGAALVSWGLALASADVVGRSRVPKLNRSLWALRPVTWVALGFLLIGMTVFPDSEVALFVSMSALAAAWSARFVYPFLIRAGDFISATDPDGQGCVSAFVDALDEQTVELRILDKSDRRCSSISLELIGSRGEQVRIPHSEFKELNPKLVWR